MNLQIFLANVLAVFFLWLYSNRLKRMPLLGNITVALLTSASLMILTFLFNDNARLVIVYSFFAFFVNLIREIIKDMEDMRGDKAFGCRTLPIVIGIRKSKLFIYALMIIFVILLSWLVIEQNNSFLKVYFVILVIPGSFFIYKLMKADTVKDYNQLSLYSKLIMLSGIVSMVFFKLI